MIRSAQLVPRAGPISSNSTLPHLFVYAYLPPLILFFFCSFEIAIIKLVHTYYSSDVLYTIFVG